MSDISTIPIPYKPTVNPIVDTLTVDDIIYSTYTWQAQSKQQQQQPLGRIVFVHGYRDDHRLYYPLADAVTKAGYDFFYYDQIGEGSTVLTNGKQGIANDKSAYAGIDAVIDHNIKITDGKIPIHLIGHSMGGGLVLNYACMNKQHVSKLKSIIASAPLIKLHDATYPGLFIESIVRFVCAVVPGGKALRVKSPLSIDRLTCDKEWTNWINSTSDPAGLDGAFVETRDFILRGRDLLKRETQLKITDTATTPVLICHGLDDEINDSAASKEFADNVDGVKLIEYPGGKHLLMVEVVDVREKFFNDIIEFLNSTN